MTQIKTRAQAQSQPCATGQGTVEGWTRLDALSKITQGWGWLCELLSVTFLQLVLTKEREGRNPRQSLTSVSPRNYSYLSLHLKMAGTRKRAL